MDFDGYASPRLVDNREECFFYHTMELPQVGLVQGIWDLRGGVREYLGGVDVRGKRVLELGPASGFVTFHMEGQGADVVGCDLCETDAWDIVPYAGLDLAAEASRRSKHIRLLNSSFWLSHRLVGSKARIIYGPVYTLPPEAGPFDVAVFGSILLHLRDPFLALQRALSLTRETVVVTDMMSRYRPRLLDAPRRILPRKLRRPGMTLVPDYTLGAPRDTWWRLDPDIVRHFLGILGFDTVSVTYHKQRFQGRWLPLFTVVGKRTRGQALEV